jgi:hypothetical protein
LPCVFGPACTSQSRNSLATEPLLPALWTRQSGPSPKGGPLPVRTKGGDRDSRSGRYRSTSRADGTCIPPESSHRRRGLAPRCRLIASWGCTRSQGLGCSPIKAVRELGLERRETVRSLSAVGVGCLRGAVRSTRGPGWTNLWCTSCHASGMAG